jgi:hypothetical protein
VLNSHSWGCGIDSESMSGTTRDRVKRDGHIFRATRALPRHAGIRDVVHTRRIVFSLDA